MKHAAVSTGLGKSSRLSDVEWDDPPGVWKGAAGPQHADWL